MTGEDNNFLARWSRRKRAVDTSEHSDRPEDLGRADGGMARLPPPVMGEEPEAEATGAQSSEPLPSIEDLTAESDISAFLRAGVPQALKTAALRRAWSLDPAIRDYVGPAEYAYDYNSPGSIPGFGPAPGWDPATAAEYAQKIVKPSMPENQLPAKPADDHHASELQSVRREPEPLTTETPVVEQPDPSTLAETGVDDSPPGRGDEVMPSLPRHGGAVPR